jgi:hypothetical protein
VISMLFYSLKDMAQSASSKFAILVKLLRWLSGSKSSLNRVTTADSQQEEVVDDRTPTDGVGPCAKCGTSPASTPYQTSCGHVLCYYCTKMLQYDEDGRGYGDCPTCNAIFKSAHPFGSKADITTGPIELN